MASAQFVILSTAVAGTLFFVIFMTILLLPHKKETHEIPPPPVDTGYKCLQEQYDK